MSQEVALRHDGARVVADSREVAEKFGKQHKDVLKAIDNLLKSHTAQICAMGFEEVHELHPTVAGRMVRYYEMDRDAFTLLVMGFTGEAALGWKRKYIAAFNRMEAELRATPTMIDFKDPQVLLGCFQALQTQVQEKDLIIADLAPKAEALELIAESNGSFTRTVAAKNLGVSPQALIKWLRVNEWTYRRPGSECKYL